MSRRPGRGRCRGSLGALLAFAVLSLLAPKPAAPQAAGAKTSTAHGFSMYGDLKYPAGFPHFQYVNPEAPKGGDVKLAAIGTFDTLNPFVLKGVPAVGLGNVFDTLTVQSDDEPFSEYGLVAETIEIPADRSWVAFTLRPQARFHDGSPITVEDVIWTFEALKTKGRPFYRAYYAQVTKAEKVGERKVRFAFGPGDNRELPLIVGQLPVLSRAYWSKRDFEKTTLEPPLGSGAYRVESLDPGRSITYRRVKDYWAAEAAGERGPGQLRLDALRLLPRLDGRDRGAQGRRVRLPSGERGEELGDRVCHASGDARSSEEGGDSERGPHRDAGIRVQHRAGRSSRIRESAARWPTRSTSSGATRTCSTARTRGPRATSRTRSSPRAACRAARS